MREPLALEPVLEGMVHSNDGAPVVHLDVEPELCALADRLRLRCVVGNLVSNAVHHGSGDVVVRASSGWRVSARSCSRAHGR